MKKFAFIVEENFLDNEHFGVRNFFTTIKFVVEKMGHQADYVTYREKALGGSAWYKITPRYFTSKNDEYLEYDEEDNYKLTFSLIEPFQKKENPPERYIQSLGKNLDGEDYDCAFITIPWGVGKDFEVHARKLVGIVYDCIPNLYAITRETFDFSLSYRHAHGYHFFNNACDYIMADSRESIEQYKNFFGQDVKKGKLGYFKPFVPWFIGKENCKNLIKERAVILSAPFDLRKGLKEMPSFLNELRDVIDTLYIYGLPRCGIEDINSFFRELNLRHIIYYPYISSENLAKLYAKCKFLFFPSFQEGLGLPLLEAQVCGCRVITRDIAPMNELCLDGSICFDEPKEVLEQTRLGLLDNEFPYEKLKEKARKLYLYEDIKSFVKDVLL